MTQDKHWQAKYEEVVDIIKKREIHRNIGLEELIARFLLITQMEEKIQKRFLRYSIIY